MGEMARKDYGTDSIVDQSTETMKRVNTLNSPFSVEATGLDKRKDLLVKMDSDSIDTIRTNWRVLFGNKFGVVTSVTYTSSGATFVSPLISLEVNTPVPGSDELTSKSYTKAELLAATNLFIEKSPFGDVINFTSQGYKFTGDRFEIINKINTEDGTSGLDPNSRIDHIQDYMDGLDAVDDSVLIASLVSALDGEAV